MRVFSPGLAIYLDDWLRRPDVCLVPLAERLDVVIAAATRLPALHAPLQAFLLSRSRLREESLTPILQPETDATNIDERMCKVVAARFVIGERALEIPLRCTRSKGQT